MALRADYYVYEHWRPDKNVCFYVGKGSRARAWDMTQRNPWHKAIVSKLTALGYCVDVRMVAVNLCEVDAHAREIALIATYPPKTLCNLTTGGEGVSGLVMSADVVHRLAAARVGVKRGPQSAAHREKIGAAQRGKILTAEHRAKLSAARRKRATKLETLEKMRATMLAKPRAWHEARVKALIGRKVSAETRLKLSQSHKGKTIGAAQRAKISATLLRRGAARRALNKEAA